MVVQHRVLLVVHALKAAKRTIFGAAHVRDALVAAALVPLLLPGKPSLADDHLV